MNVILSCGQGPLHFVSSAESLRKKVDSLKFICGYVPSSETSLLLRALKIVKGKKVLSAIKKHCIADDRIKICSCSFAEGIKQLYDIAIRFVPALYSITEKYPWIVFGWQSRQYIANADVFHVRSGAGHGGAIRRAKRLGMKVLVDHSIAHPAFMDQNMASEYERNGARFCMGMGSPFWRMIDEECRSADLIQVNSDFVKKTFVDAGYDATKIRVVYLGVRADFWGIRLASQNQFNPALEDVPLKLLFTGGFGFRKGAEYILEACRLLKERGVRYSLDVVGDYTAAQSLIKRYAKYELPISFHGQKPQEALKEFLSVSDVYVFPSLAEGCAQSGMEAMAAGLCVVATRESGLPIHDGENGFLIPGKDAYAIANKIEWLARHRKTIDVLGRNAARLIRDKFTWDKYAENTFKIYEELLK